MKKITFVFPLVYTELNSLIQAWKVFDLNFNCHFYSSVPLLSNFHFQFHFLFSITHPMKSLKFPGDTWARRYHKVNFNRTSTSPYISRRHNISIFRLRQTLSWFINFLCFLISLSLACQQKVYFKLDSMCDHETRKREFDFHSRHYNFDSFHLALNVILTNNMFFDLKLGKILIRLVMRNSRKAYVRTRVDENSNKFCAVECSDHWALVKWNEKFFLPIFVYSLLNVKWKRKSRKWRNMNEKKTTTQTFSNTEKFWKHCQNRNFEAWRAISTLFCLTKFHFEPGRLQLFLVGSLRRDQIRLSSLSLWLASSVLCLVAISFIVLQRQ